MLSVWGQMLNWWKNVCSSVFLFGRNKTKAQVGKSIEKSRRAPKPVFYDRFMGLGNKLSSQSSRSDVVFALLTASIDCIKNRVQWKPWSLSSHETPFLREVTQCVATGWNFFCSRNAHNCRSTLSGQKLSLSEVSSVLSPRGKTSFPFHFSE